MAAREQEAQQRTAYLEQQVRDYQQHTTQMMQQMQQQQMMQTHQQQMSWMMSQANLSSPPGSGLPLPPYALPWESDDVEHAPFPATVHSEPGDTFHREQHEPHLEPDPRCSVELWEIIVDGYQKPQYPARLSSTEFYNRQLNASGRDKIRSGINRKLLDQVNDIDSAKELWDRIVVLQEGTDLIQSALYESAKQEATMFMIREGKSVADAYARLGALRVKVKGLGCEKYNDGFEMNEAFMKCKVIAMIAVKQKDTNLALNLQIITKSVDLNADDLVSYVAANENMAKTGERLMAMNRVDEASHNLALKARVDHEREEVYEIEEDEEMTSTSDIATDFAFFAKKYKANFLMFLNEKKKKKKKRTCYNCDEDGHFGNECPYEKRVDRPKFVKGVKPRLKPNPINDRYKKNKELDASKKELEVAHASLTRDLDHLERANQLAKDELKKHGENHDLLQETYKKALGSMNDPIIAKDVASSSTSFTDEHAKLVEEHVRLQEELSLHVETNAYLGSLVTKYGLNYNPNESSCEQATILEENVRLTKELAKFTTAKNKMALDDLLSKQRSNNQKFGLVYVTKSYKKNNYKKEKPAQEKNKKVTNDGKASKGKATSGDRTGPNNHYALFIDYYAGKQLKKKHPIKSIVTTSRPLELLHLDLFGPSHYDTLGGSKYGLVIVDDYSRYSWVFLLKSKDETHRKFIIFAKKAQRMYESEIKAIRTDNGTEFKNYTMQEFVDDEGIKHEF
ncbi:hypothetical protein QYE76_029266 [Lolium multiflorum]|uniref:Uncharacterized protein n=1 Tax=Lolium multiflorum TaxID=4521 RepID=A0AAD8QR38_LOLMU|nr:hypothetical protein QYE76_029266 [Lolium multiflorum]